MSDIGSALRRASSVYSDSYPPDAYAPDPHINTLNPSSVSAAAGPTTVAVNGTNFEPTSVVEVDGAPQTTLFVNAGRLTISYDPTVAGPVQFTVRNTSGKESNSVTFNASATALAATQQADDTTHVITDGTVDEVKAYVTDHPEAVAEVTELERSGKARVTLLDWLADQGDQGDQGDEGD